MEGFFFGRYNPKKHLNLEEFVMWIVRLFGLAIAALSYWLVNSQWTDFYADGTFSLRYVVAGPIGIVMGIFLFLFPKFVGVPEKTSEKIIVSFVFLLGIAAGLYNLYLMDPSKLGL